MSELKPVDTDKCIICLTTFEQCTNSFEPGVECFFRGKLTKEIVIEDHDNIPIGEYWVCLDCKDPPGDFEFENDKLTWQCPDCKSMSEDDELGCPNPECLQLPDNVA